MRTRLVLQPCLEVYKIDAKSYDLWFQGKVLYHKFRADVGNTEAHCLWLKLKTTLMDGLPLTMSRRAAAGRAQLLANFAHELDNVWFGSRNRPGAVPEPSGSLSTAIS